MPPIVALISLRIRTQRLESMADFYASAFGLEASGQSTDRIGLKGVAGQPPQLVLSRGERRFEGLVFALRSTDDLHRAAAELNAKGFPTIESHDQGEYGAGFTIHDPDGNELTFTAAEPPAVVAPAPADRPLYLSHVVLNSSDAPRLLAFYLDVLGFTVSDAYEKGLLTFLRCDQPQHHCLGISPGESSGLNHFAMDCGNVDGLMRSVGRMSRLGHEPIWGPGRHGPGGNIFCYYQDPDGFVPEFTSDVLQIEGPDWQAKEWARTPANGNTWGTGAPSPRAVALMAGTER